MFPFHNLEPLRPLSNHVKRESIGKIVQALTLVGKLRPFGGEGKRLQFMEVQL